MSTGWKRVGAPEAGVEGGCELPEWVLGTELGRLQEQYVLVTAKPPLSPAPNSFQQ